MWSRSSAKYKHQISSGNIWLKDSLLSTDVCTRWTESTSVEARMNGAELIEAGAEISWCDGGWLCSNSAQTSNMHWCYSESETTAREQSWKRLGHFGFSLGIKHERRTWSSTNKINEFENVLQSCSAVRGLWEKDAVCAYCDLTRGFLQRLLRRLAIRVKSRARPNSATFTSQGNLLTMTFLRAKSQWIICTENQQQ